MAFPKSTRSTMVPNLLSWLVSTKSLIFAFLITGKTECMYSGASPSGQKGVSALCDCAALPKKKIHSNAAATFIKMIFIAPNIYSLIEPAQTMTQKKTGAKAGRLFALKSQKVIWVPTPPMQRYIQQTFLNLLQLHQMVYRPFRLVALGNE